MPNRNHSLLAGMIYIEMESNKTRRVVCLQLCIVTSATIWYLVLMVSEHY